MGMDQKKYIGKRMRKKIIAGNWKMNLLQKEALDLAKAIGVHAQASDNKIVIFPPSLYLNELVQNNATPLTIGSQNAHFLNSGAFTGEVSMTQLQSIGINTLLIGHSERRDLFHEDHSFLRHKVTKAIELGFSIYFCCGEHLVDREKQIHFDTIKSQLDESLLHLTAAEFQQVVIAYEPVWAIGTGVTASKDQAEEMHSYIRSLLKTTYGSDIAEATHILYGGSCKPENAEELFSQPNIDGGLIGGASLNISDFIAIVNYAELA